MVDYTHPRNNSPDTSITCKTGQVPVICLLEYVHLVPDKCLQVQILLHLEDIHFPQTISGFFESSAVNVISYEALQYPSQV